MDSAALYPSSISSELRRQSSEPKDVTGTLMMTSASLMPILVFARIMTSMVAPASANID